MIQSIDVGIAARHKFCILGLTGLGLATTLTTEKAAKTATMKNLDILMWVGS